MAGPLDPRLARTIYAAFRGKLRGGVIRRATVPAGTPLNDHGDPETTIPQDTKIEGFAEGYSRTTRAQANIPGTDVKVNIFAASCPGLRPAAGMQVRLDKKDRGRTISQWYQIRGPVEADPAEVLWECQSFEIGAPAHAG